MEWYDAHGYVGSGC